MSRESCYINRDRFFQCTLWRCNNGVPWHLALLYRLQCRWEEWMVEQFKSKRYVEVNILNEHKEENVHHAINDVNGHRRNTFFLLNHESVAFNFHSDSYINTIEASFAVTQHFKGNNRHVADGSWAWNEILQINRETLYESMTFRIFVINVSLPTNLHCMIPRQSNKYCI